MDIQKLIGEVVEKLNIDPALVKAFITDPAGMLKKTFNIDLDDAQIKQVIEGVKSKIDLDNIDLSRLGVPEEATGLLGKLKGLFGK